MGAVTPGKDYKAVLEEQVDMLGGLGLERGGKSLHQGHVPGWIRRDTPSLGGAWKMLTWHHGGWMAQGAKGKRMP